MKVGVLSFLLTMMFATIIFSGTWRLFQQHFHDPKWVLFLFSTSFVIGGFLTYLFTLAVRRDKRG